jgi:hypothetical protein
MRRFLSTVAVSAAVVLSPQVVLGQDVIGRTLDPVENLRYVTGSNVAALWGNVQVGPYKADLITTPYPTIPNITLYCVDFANGINGGDTWYADVTSIGTGASDATVGGTLGNTRLGNNPGASLDAYRQSAFLASLFASWASYTADTYTYASSTYSFGNRQGVWSGIHSAVWSIMDATYPGAYTPSEVTNAALANAMAAPFVTLAANALVSNFTGAYAMDFDQWAVVTDVTDPGRQEFLVRTTVAPEPATYVMLLSGLVLLFGVAQMRRRGVAQA